MNRFSLMKDGLQMLLQKLMFEQGQIDSLLVRMSKNGAYHGWYSTKVPKKLTFLRALKQILVKALTSRLKVPEKHPEFPDEDVRK